MTLSRSPAENKKSLYLDDRPTVKDEFNYDQIAHSLKEVIKQQDDFPTHISLMGEWGSGKSTVLKLLTESLKEERRIAIKEFSVWKYSDDTTTLQRRIIRQVKQELKSDAKKQTEKDFSSKMNDSVEENNVTMQGNNFGALLIAPFTGNILVAVVVTIFSLLQISILFAQPFVDWITTNFPMIILFYTTAAIFNKSAITVTKANKTALRPMVYDDQFENEFKSTVQRYTKAKKIDKLVLVFDDLDRLPPNQLYSALNTIKSFLKADKCIFIVPCDERVLRDELEYVFESRQSTVDVSEFLNKTFDVTMKMPMVEKNNMRTYAMKLLEDNNIDWYHNGKVQEHIHSIISTLIHSEIDTPRKVKKNLNAFASDWYLAEKRDNSSGSDILTAHPRKIAIMTVIKTNYLKFYEIIQENPLLFKDVESSEDLEKYLEEVIENTDINRNDRNSHQIKEDDEDREESTTKNQESKKINIGEYVSLSFLKRVFPQLPKDSRPYLYFSNKTLNPITSIPKLNEMKESLLNADAEMFGSLFEDTGEEDKWILFNSVPTELFGEMDERNTLSTLISIPVTGTYTQQNIYWEEKFREHIDYFSEHSSPKKIYEFMKEMKSDNSTKKILGESLTKNQPTEHILDLWIEHSGARDTLYLEDLESQIFTYNTEMAETINKEFTLPKLIFTLEEDHPMTKYLHWQDILDDVLITINKQNDGIRAKNKELEDDEKEPLNQYTPGFNFVEWIQDVNNKTGTHIDAKTLRRLVVKILKNLNKANFLEGVGEYWESVVQQSDNDKEIAETINFIRRYPRFTEKYFSDEVFKILNSKYARYNLSELNDEVSEEISKLLSYYEENDEEKLLNVLELLKDISIVSQWSIKSISLIESSLDTKLIEVINHNEKRIELGDLYEVLEEKFDYKNSKVVNSVKSLIENSNRIYEYGRQEGYFKKWFDIETSENVLDIHQDHFENFIVLKGYATSNKEEYSSFLEDVITTLLQKSNLIATNHPDVRNLQHRAHWKKHLNISFVQLSKCGNFVDWSSLLSEWKEVALEGKPQTSISVINQLSSSTINQTLPLIDDNSPIKDTEINDLIVKHSNLAYLSHTKAIVNRWLEFSRKQRNTIIEGMEKDFYQQFIEQLLAKFKKQPYLEYIQQLQSESVQDDDKRQIVEAIVTSSNNEDLGSWVNKIYELKEGELNHWVYTAFDIIAEKNSHIRQIDLALLRDSLMTKNNKTIVTLKLIPLMYSKKDAEKAKHFIREVLIGLEEDERFSEIATKVKNMFGWRKSKRHFGKN